MEVAPIEGVVGSTEVDGRGGEQDRCGGDRESEKTGTELRAERMRIEEHGNLPGCFGPDHPTDAPRFASTVPNAFQEENAT
jgi:hypothetical protein